MTDISFDPENLCYSCGAVVWNKALHQQWHLTTSYQASQTAASVDQLMRGPDGR